MKQYTVLWWEAADDDLLNLWLASSQRSALTTAAFEIDRLLSRDPNSIGKSPHEGLYVLEVAPLRVQFSIEEADRVVRVWTVRLI